MHLPDTFLSTQTAVPLLGSAFVAVAHAVRRVRASLFENGLVRTVRYAGEVGEVTLASRRLSESGARRIERMVAVGALVFAFQMVNIALPGALGGVSGHLLGGVFAGLVVGPFEALLVMSAVLGIQAFVFADGGLLALGANILNMGLVGGVGGYAMFLYVRWMLGIKRYARTVAILCAAWCSVVAAACCAALELAASGAAPLKAVLATMLTYHAGIGVGEAVFTVCAIALLERYRYPLHVSERRGGEAA